MKHQYKTPTNGLSYEIFLTHALMNPWKKILEEGQIKTWAPITNTHLRHLYSKPVSRAVQSLDSFYWKMKWTRITGLFILGFEYLFANFVRSSNPRVVNPITSYTQRDVLVNLPDLYLLSNVKSLAMHRFAKESDCNFIVFTTSSSYLNIKKLEEHLRYLPKEKLVAGRVMESGDKKFISGSFRIYTPDVLQEIEKFRNSYKSWLAEDLAMGVLLESAGFDFINLPSLDISSLDELNRVPELVLANTVHFRLKSGNAWHRNDVKIMTDLHKKLISLGAV